ncbi:extensin-like domain-containing protein [Paragemmobacter ruber]|uniref:Extensin family protein n=1 Tax=Paragemmobacter ruber TaxID=1985673 RepID=A0ABW9Y4K6_9RHOB|nr:extensin family protein [Rhodobacter ruber]NBE06770.1 extensin family protein [Rhodobacter ruber]
MRWGVVGALCLWSFLMAGGAAAQEIATSPRPLARPAAAPQASPPQAASTESPAAPGVIRLAVAPATADTPRPRARPGVGPDAGQGAVAQALPAPDAVAVMTVPRPRPRPEGLRVAVPQEAPVTTAAANPPPAAQRERRGGLFGGLFQRREQADRSTPADGYVCGDPAIRGEELAQITSRVQGCGVEAPVRVTQVDGIRLTTPATIDCATATALKTWINEGMRPAFRRQEVVELRIAASYICRPRNNRPGAKISEHGRGKAIDISGFILSDGRELSVQGDYNRQMRQAHRAACGIFGTTLGPGSDGYHEDHLHFDTAAHRNGAYCR